MQEIIYIRMLSVELGPFSEQQVRQFLAEGHLMPSDPAKCDAKDEWAPLSEVLERLPPPPPPPPLPPPLPELEPSITPLVTEAVISPIAEAIPPWAPAPEELVAEQKIEAVEQTVTVPEVETVPAVEPAMAPVAVAEETSEKRQTELILRQVQDDGLLGEGVLPWSTETPVAEEKIETVEEAKQAPEMEVPPLAEPAPASVPVPRRLPPPLPERKPPVAHLVPEAVIPPMVEPAVAGLSVSEAPIVDKEVEPAEQAASQPEEVLVSIPEAPVAEQKVEVVEQVPTVTPLASISTEWSWISAFVPPAPEAKAPVEAPIPLAPASEEKPFVEAAVPPVLIPEESSAKEAPSTVESRTDGASPVLSLEERLAVLIRRRSLQVASRAPEEGLAEAGWASSAGETPRAEPAIASVPVPDAPALVEKGEPVQPVVTIAPTPPDTSRWLWKPPIPLPMPELEGTAPIGPTPVTSPEPVEKVDPVIQQSVTVQPASDPSRWLWIPPVVPERQKAPRTRPDGAVKISLSSPDKPTPAKKMAQVTSMGQLRKVTPVPLPVSPPELPQRVIQQATEAPRPLQATPGVPRPPKNPYFRLVQSPAVRQGMAYAFIVFVLLLTLALIFEGSLMLDAILSFWNKLNVSIYQGAANLFHWN